MALRVLILSDYMPLHSGGGVERTIMELCNRLGDRGHNVTALTLKTRPAPALETHSNLTIHRVPAVDLTSSLRVQFALSLQLMPSMYRLVRRLQPDVVHAHNFYFRTTEVAALLRAFVKVPLVTTIHLGRMEGSGPIKALTRAYESTVGRFIIGRSDYLMTVSQAVADNARRLGGQAKPLAVIPPGIDTKTFYPDANPKSGGRTVLFVGRLVSNKGPQTLVKAVPIILKRHPGAQFLIVGIGPLRRTLEKEVQKLGVEGAVKFLGYYDDLPALMRQSNVLVRPSSFEGMPLTVMEAMASGIPVVATPVGGTPELIEEGVHGYLFPVGDHRALADSVNKVLDNPEEAARMGLRGRGSVESRYTWDQVVEKTEQVYAQVASR